MQLQPNCIDAVPGRSLWKRLQRRSELSEVLGIPIFNTETK